MKPERLLPPLVFLSLALAACRGGAPAATAAPSGGDNTPPAAPPTQVTELPTTSAGDDVSAIDACKLVTAQEVADLAGGTIFRELDQKPSPNCTYEIDPPGPGSYDTIMVYVEPVSLVAPLIEAIPDQLGDPVAGIGDAAYLEHDAPTDTYHLTALVRNRFGLEVIGPTGDLTKAVGELFLSRLLGP